MTLFPVPNSPLETPMQPPAMQMTGRPFGSTNTSEPEEELPDIPRMRGSLKLTRDQATALVQRIHARIIEVKREMGLETDGRVRPNSWMDVRLRNEASYENDLTWRKALSKLFNESNFTLGTNKRYARLAAARYRQDLLGTRPYFGAFTTSEGDPELTKSAETYVQERIGESNIGETLREAQKVAVIRNEAVVKTTYTLDQSQYTGPAKVLVGGDGMPIYTPNKELLIYENDDFVPDPSTEGMFRLKKDPSFQTLPGAYQYQQFEALPQVLTQYDNVEAETLDLRDFLCPLKRRTIHHADINVHIYTETPEALRKKWGNFESAQSYFNARPKSGARQPKPQHNEQEEDASRVLANVTIGDVYIRCAIEEGGPEFELWVTMDLDAGEIPEAIIFSDYLGNHMNRRPFAVIPGVEKVPQRWYGVGVFTMMEHPGLYIDTQFNRYNFKDSNEASCTFRVPSAVREWKNNTPTKLGGHEIYNVEPGYDAKNPPLFRVNLMENSEHGKELMLMMQQAGDLQFGAISAQDASASDLNQSKTATGIMSIERSSNTLTQDTEHEHVIGIEQVLAQAVEWVLEKMDPATLMFGPNNILLDLNRDEIRSLPRKVKLLLTRTRSAEQLVTNEKAEAVALRYMRLSVREQFYLRPFYINQLKGLEVNDADQRLPEVTREEFEAWMKAQAEAAAKGPPKEEKEPSTSINYKDAPPSVQRQMEQDAGYQPASEEEAAAIEEAKQKELAAKTAPKPESTPKKDVPRPK